MEMLLLTCGHAMCEREFKLSALFGEKCPFLPWVANHEKRNGNFAFSAGWQIRQMHTNLFHLVTGDLKGQYHAIFSNTLKIEKTLFG